MRLPGFLDFAETIVNAVLPRFSRLELRLFLPVELNFNFVLYLFPVCLLLFARLTDSLRRRSQFTWQRYFFHPPVVFIPCPLEILLRYLTLRSPEPRRLNAAKSPSSRSRNFSRHPREGWKGCAPRGLREKGVQVFRCGDRRSENFVIQPMLLVGEPCAGKFLMIPELGLERLYRVRKIRVFFRLFFFFSNRED